MTVEERGRRTIRRAFRWCLALALVAAVLTSIGAAGRWQAFQRAYLVAFYYWAGISLGAMAVLLIHHLVGGTWGALVRRPLEAATALVPLAAVLFLPVALGLEALYPWSREEVLRHDPHVAHKAWWLNPTGFRVRAALYFAVWIAIAAALVVGSHREEKAGGGPWSRRLKTLSGPGLVAFFLAASFASVDWVMSLEPTWLSTGFGVVQIAGHGVTGLALAVLGLVGLARSGLLGRALEEEALNDLGSLMFAFVFFWIYVSFMQYLIIWSGNLPEEVRWYLHRTEGGWEWVGLVLPVFHFAIPFALLLSRRVKSDPRFLGAIALSLLVVHFVEVYWTIMPSFHPGELGVCWLDFTTPLALGGLWLAGFLWQLPRRDLLPPRAEPTA